MRPPSRVLPVILAALIFSSSVSAQADENFYLKDDLHDNVIGISENGEELGLPLRAANNDLNTGTAPSFEFPVTDPQIPTINDPRFVGPDSIIGTDDRRKAKANPAVVQIQRNGYNHCTGWMIADDTLVTAAHCLYDWSRGDWVSKLTFRPSDWSQWSYEFASQSWISSDYARSGSANSDWGVVKFPRPISASWFGMKPSTYASELTGERATITGFPGEKGRGLIRDYAQLWSANGTLQAGSEARVCYSIDTTGGQSGSPVYLGDRTAVAIHSHGVGDGACSGNSGVRITPRMIDTFNDLKERRNNATPVPGSRIGSSHS